MIRLGIVGCGAAVQRTHRLPIAPLPEVVASWIVDAQLDRARVVAQEHGIPYVTHDYTSRSS